jgi:hypothetical protein
VSAINASISMAPSPASPAVDGAGKRGAPVVSTLSGADLYPAVTPSAAPAPVAPSSPFASSAFGDARITPPPAASNPFATSSTSATLGGAAAPLRVSAAPVDVTGLETAAQAGRSPVKKVLFGAGLLALGLTAGFLLFSPGKSPAPAPSPSAANVGAAAEPTVALPSIPPPESTPSAAAEPSAGKDEASGRPRGAAGRTAPKVEPETTSKLTGDLKNLGSGSAPPAGPRADPVGAQAAPPGTELGAGQLQSTVARYTGGVKRSCWQPALDTRNNDAPTSARVNVTIVVAPSGNVQDVTTSGDPRGYPGLANCIAGRVRGWQFPQASGATTLNVPFVFAAQ